MIQDLLLLTAFRRSTAATVLLGYPYRHSIFLGPLMALLVSVLIALPNWDGDRG